MKYIYCFIVTTLGFIGCQNNTTDNQAQSKKYTSIVETDTVFNLIEPEVIVDTFSICLPYPNENFFTLKQNNFETDDTLFTGYRDEVYWYLITNLDSLTPKKIIEKEMTYEQYEMITKWEQEFSNKVIYVKHEAVEGGSTVYLYTFCKNKQAFFNTIAPIIEDQDLDSTFYYPEMSWNKDSTLYKPLEGGAGCYYEIKKDSVNNYMLEWYCGC